MNIVYCGIDLHNDFLVIGVNKLLMDVNEIETFKIRNENRTIKRFFNRQKMNNELKVCYEAGPCGYSLYRQLTKMGIDCEVIAPSLIPKGSGDKIKTDRRDAKRLTKLYRTGNLTSIRVPTVSEENERSIIRLREQYSEKIRRVKHQIGKFLVYKGIHYELGNKWTIRYMNWLKRICTHLNKIEQYILENYLNELTFLEMLRDEVDKKIIELSESAKYKDHVTQLKCFRGIETFTAMAILTSVIDFKRFQKAEQFMSFVGLTPREYSSGNNIIKGKISKNGNILLRKLLVESSKHYRHPARVSQALSKRWSAVRVEVRNRAYKALKRLHKKYYKLLYTKGPNKAAVAVARELCGFIWATMNDIPLRKN